MGEKEAEEGEMEWRKCLAFAKLKFKLMEVACPMCRIPLGSGGNLVTTCSRQRTVHKAPLSEGMTVIPYHLSALGDGAVEPWSSR